MDKTLPQYNVEAPVPPRRRSWHYLLLRAALGVLLVFALFRFSELSAPLDHEAEVRRAFRRLAAKSSVCPQEPEYDPKKALAGHHIGRPPLRQAAERLSQAVQIDTSIGDNWPAPEKDGRRWEETFSPFRDWLQKTFPSVYRTLRFERVHGHGLLYTWEGSDPSLKPLLLTAHQDVVPVSERSTGQWRYPPFSGHIDLEHQAIWGRGSYDAKSWLVASLSAVESLVKAGWKPRRTVLLSYGYDEESSGPYGAKWLGRFLQERYGPDSVAMIVDEGNGVVPAKDPIGVGIPLAMPAVEEKGTISVTARLDTMGGHSSVPPPHTSIGIMARIVTLLEDHPFAPEIVPGYNPSLRRLQCIRDAPGISPTAREALYELEWAEKALQPEHQHTLLAALPAHARWLERRLSHSQKSERVEHAKRKLLSSLKPFDLQSFYTTQAVDLIQGGLKINALPESVMVAVNHRVAPFANTTAVKQRYEKLLAPIANEYALDLDAFGKEIRTNASRSLGRLTLGSTDWILDNLPKTPFEGHDATAFRLLSSVIRQTWHVDEPRQILHENEDAVPQGKQTYKDPLLVAPSTMVGNTDTHWYSVRISEIRPSSHGSRLRGTFSGSVPRRCTRTSLALGRSSASVRMQRACNAG